MPSVVDVMLIYRHLLVNLWMFCGRLIRLFLQPLWNLAHMSRKRFVFSCFFVWNYLLFICLVQICPYLIVWLCRYGCLASSNISKSTERNTCENARSQRMHSQEITLMKLSCLVLEPFCCCKCTANVWKLVVAFAKICLRCSLKQRQKLLGRRDINYSLSKLKN